VIAENLSLGRPSVVSLIFDRKIRPATPGPFATTVVTRGVDPRLAIRYRSSQIKEYFKEGRAIRIETTINDPYKDLKINKRIRHLGELRDRAREMNDRILSLQRAASTPDLAASLFERVALPSVRDGQRTVALRYGDPRVMALLAALALAVHHVAPFSNAELRANVERLLGNPYRPAQMTYDLRRLRANGLIRRLEHRNQYVPTTDGTKVAILFTKTYERIVRPLLTVDDAPPELLVELRQAFRTIDRAVDDRAKEAGVAA
jgi:DNA-binding transcriptional ArsR family regulator